MKLVECRTMKPAVRIVVVITTLLLGAPSVHAATVAYWRFETGPANTDVPHAGLDGNFDGNTPDVSGNGNSLSAWSQGGWAGFAYRAGVPFNTIPQSNNTNRFCIKNTGSYPAMFTSATNSLPTGINAQTITPAQFTIEASYKAEANAGYRTVVCRDARNVSTANGDLGALYLQVRPDDSVGITFTDVSGYTYSAFSPPGWIYGFNYGVNPEGNGTPWHNLAAVSDGSTLKMYVNNVLVASTDMTTSGSPNRSLAKGTTTGTDWKAGGWAVGRGLYAGAHTDRAFGLIDEVRISNSALTPGEFLSMARPSIAGVKVAGGTATLNVTGGQPSAACYVLQSVNPLLPMTNWTQITVRAFDANGKGSFPVPVSTVQPQMFYALKGVIPPPAPGALTYELAGGWETWPADVRARIIYAMDGAVAQYNRYGTFNKHLYANYNPGVPTAQGNYNGWIDFGANAGFQQYRPALHEVAHTLGVGTTWQWGANLSGGVWTGASSNQQIKAFDGPGAFVNSDGTHFWGGGGGGPYGLNYDNEGNTENYRRHVLMVAAFRRDMGIE